MAASDVVEGSVGDHGKPGAVKTMRMTFHGFASLPHEVGERTYSPEAERHGHRWKLHVCVRAALMRSTRST